jgi:putative PIN family toxin of toxin-antitoxin system
MQRLVIDTNCLLASINPRGACFKLYELFIAQEFEWVLSNEILTEYEEQVTRRYSVRTAQQVHDVLTTAPNAYFQEAYYKWQLIEADPDDNKFVDVAIAANADYLVTNDGHFDVLKQLEFPRVPIINFQAFLKNFQ